MQLLTRISLCLLIIFALAMSHETTGESATKLSMEENVLGRAVPDAHRTSERKVHWPHLVGGLAADVEAAIKSERPELTVKVVPQGSMVTMDMREDRVRIFVDRNGKVVQAPRVG